MDLKRTVKEMKPSANAFARGLGWFSIGLGLAELMRPQTFAEKLGMDGQENVLRAYGVREIINGIGLLSADDPEPWIWGRVGGDALDISTLAVKLNDTSVSKQNVILAILAVAGVTALDLACAASLAKEKRQEEGKQWDYSNRSGLPRASEALNGAFSDPRTSPDMLIPEALRPYGSLQ